MKNKGFLVSFIAIAFLCVGCTSSNEETINNLNGYWGIHKVKKINGDVQVYKMNPAVDYIQIDSTGQKGFRLKVRPKINGSFTTTREAEHFTLKMENDSLRFYYKTPMDSWKETLISSEKNTFTVKNSRGITYTYNRFKSLKKQLKAHGQAQKK